MNTLGDSTRAWTAGTALNRYRLVERIGWQMRSTMPIGSTSSIAT